MRDAHETADLSGFLICLSLGLGFSFQVLIPALREVQMETIKYLFGVGFGFGLGVCLYLIWVPIQHLMGKAFQRISIFLDSLVEKSNQRNLKNQKQQNEGGQNES